jgi:hypothetical protein
MEILIPLAPFIMVIVIVVVSKIYKNKEQTEIHKTLRMAIEKGQNLSKEDFDILRNNVKVKSPMDDIRNGLITMFVGIGIGVFGYVLSFHESDALYPLVGIGAIPGFIGLALVLIGLVGFAQKKKD